MMPRSGAYACAMDLATRARRAFYNAGGPWYRNRLFEAAGSERYAHPAMFGIDQRLAELMPWTGGSFLEAGAHDGFTFSNTYYLERHRGWHGVLVEPVPELRARCARRRPRSRVLGCALVGPDCPDPEVPIHFGDLMSSLNDPAHAAHGLAVAGRRPYTVSVPARTLDAVLQETGAGRLDVIVLDLEGHEPEALRGLDLERHGPRYLVVEALDLEAGRSRVDALLADHYEPGEPLSHCDLLYARRDS